MYNVRNVYRWTSVSFNLGLFTQNDCLQMWTWLWCYFYIAKLSWPWDVYTKAKHSKVEKAEWEYSKSTNPWRGLFAWHCPACRVDSRHFRGAISLFLTFCHVSKAKLVLLFIFSIQRSFKTLTTLCVNYLLPSHLLSVRTNSQRKNQSNIAKRLVLSKCETNLTNRHRSEN